MSPLAGFSDWVLALLPRIFFYPGGAGLAAALCLALITLRGAASRGRGGVLLVVLRFLTAANIPALACAWAALSILPLPGVAPLPFPVDRFSLLAVAATSLLFDLMRPGEANRDELWPDLAIVLALMSPLVLQRGLALGAQGQGVVAYVAGAAVLAGLVGLFGSARYGWSGAARWLAWWGAGMAWAAVPGEAWGWATLPAALTLGWAVQRRGWGKYAAPVACALAMSALLTALLLPPG